MFLISTKNIVSYNLKLAKIFGVYSAVYLNYLLNLFLETQELGKLVQDKYAILDRQLLYEETALEDSRQKTVEENLIECQILEIAQFKNNANKFYFYVNLELLKKFLASESKEEMLKIIPKKSKNKSLLKEVQQPKPSQRAQYISGLKKSLQEEDVVLREYICEWIDSVYGNPKGFLSNSSIKQELNQLKLFSKGDKKLEIAIWQKAILLGYRNLKWAIEQHQKETSTAGLVFNAQANSVNEEPLEVSSESF